MCEGGDGGITSLSSLLTTPNYNQLPTDPPSPPPPLQTLSLPPALSFLFLFSFSAKFQAVSRQSYIEVQNLDCLRFTAREISYQRGDTVRGHKPSLMFRLHLRNVSLCSAILMQK